MKILLRKQFNGSLLPADDEAQDKLRKIKPGKDVWCEVRVARNARHHRLYFALLNLTWENVDHERFGTFERFRKVVQMEAGHVDELVGLDGTIYQIPRSIAWDQLSQDEFDGLFPAVMTVCAKLLGDLELDILRDEVQRHAA
jgi:hypothetical protein